MKVLIISVWYPSKVNPFPGVFVKEFAGAIAAFAETVVLNVSPVEKEDIKLCGLSDVMEDKVRVVRIYYRKVPLVHKITGIFQYLKGLKYLKAQGFKPDLVNAHVNYSAVPAILSAYTASTPLVITEHSTEFLKAGGPGFLAGKIYAAVANKANLIMPVSRYLLEAMKPYNKRAVYQIFPNIFDPAVFYYKKDSSPGEEKKLLFVGALIERKGLDFLLKAFAGVEQKNIILNIVGEGPKRREYEELAKKLEISTRVNFCGHKEHKEIAELMQGSDLYVHGSSSETFGCVLMEAMACGLPVAATRVGGVPEVVDEYSGILVPFGNIEAFKAAIQNILSNPGKYNRLKIAQSAFNRFSRLKAGVRLHEIFKKVIETSLTGEAAKK